MGVLRFLLSAGAIASAALVASPAPARPAHRAPSLEGVWRVNFIMPMEALPGEPRLVVSEAEAKPLTEKATQAVVKEFASMLDPEIPMLAPQSDGLPIVRAERRTRLVVQPADGRLPYTPAVRKELTTPAPAERMDNPEDLSNAERCLVGQGQPPLTSFGLDNQIQIVRTRDAVVILVEYGSDVRIVNLKGGHGPAALASRLGDSIGHFEGRTLVVETVGMPDADRFRILPDLIVPGDSKVIERFTPLSGNELLYQFTVVDPKAFAKPWLGEFSWFRTKLGIYEHACHEGNYSLPNMLSGARYREAHPPAVRTAAAAP